MKNEQKPKDSFYGANLSILHIFLSFLCIICLGFAFYVYLFVYLNNPSKDLIILIYLLVIFTCIFGGLGFPKWIEEDKEERELRKKRRELEMIELDKKIDNIKNPKHHIY